METFCSTKGYLDFQNVIHTKKKKMYKKSLSDNCSSNALLRKPPLRTFIFKNVQNYKHDAHLNWRSS